MANDPAAAAPKAKSSKAKSAKVAKKTAAVLDKPAAPVPQLDGLFGHLSCSSGLFSKETFLSLYSCITRMLRDQQQQLTGFVMTRTLDEDAFESMACALDNLPQLPLYRMQESPHGMREDTGFLIVMTNRLCATLYWSSETHDTFQMYEGGWTFHPADTKTLAAHLIHNLTAHPAIELLSEHLENTPIDRRYDDKLNLLITSLVHGLESRNRQLTVALDQVKHLNHQVVQSERLAAIGQLSSVIAHEIRNPLGLIDLYAKLVETQLEQLNLADSPNTDKLLKNLSQIRQATGNLETILSELTNYARPLTLNQHPTDITQLVHDVCEFYTPSYQQKSVALSYPDPPANNEPPLLLHIDVDRVRQALINLLKNALEASKPETEVIVSIVSRRGSNSQVYIKVSDQGCGIAPETAKKLFTPYFSTKQAGTGLGLAHSRKILQAHGGDVELIASFPDKGSTFALILPKPAPLSATLSGKTRQSIS